MSKAWACCEEESGVVEVVFADTKGKAKLYFKYMETFDYFEFCELRLYRLKKLDYLNHPDGYVMDWNKAEDRLVLVKETGWYCSDPTLDDCKIYTASNYCDLYAEGLVTK